MRFPAPPVLCSGSVIGLLCMGAADAGVYRCADLPPLLQFANGSGVHTREDWSKRAAELQALMCSYFIGTFPDTVPGCKGNVAGGTASRRCLWIGSMFPLRRLRARPHSQRGFRGMFRRPPKGSIGDSRPQDIGRRKP